MKNLIARLYRYYNPPKPDALKDSVAPMRIEYVDRDIIHTPRPKFSDLGEDDYRRHIGRASELRNDEVLNALIDETIGEYEEIQLNGRDESQPNLPITVTVAELARTARLALLDFKSKMDGYASEYEKLKDEANEENAPDED